MCDVNFLGSFVPVFDVGNLLSSCNGEMHTRSGQTNLQNRSRVVSTKTFFMLNSAEHEIRPANKSQITNTCNFFLAKHS